MTHLESCPDGERIEALYARMARRRLDVVLIFNEANIRALTGVTCDNGCLVLSRDAAPFFITDFRYVPMLHRLAPWLETVQLKRGQTFAAAVLGRLDSPAERVGRKILSFFKNCRPTLTPKDDGSFSFSFDLAPSQAKATLKDTFDYIASRKRKVVIAVDEFQQVREFPEKGTEALLRSYIQFVPNAHFIFAGSRKHMMDAMFVSPKGPFYQSTQLMALGTIDTGKYRQFAEGFFRREGRTFSEAAFRHLYERFEGITWYIQSILNRVWTHGSGLDSVQQVDDTVDELVAESESFYFDLLRSQTPAEQSILKAVGRDGVAKSISGGDFIRRNKLPAASTVRSAAAKLTERDLLYRSDAGYVVYDRFFGLWLKRL